MGCGLRDCRELSSCEDFVFEGRHLSEKGTKVREVELHERDVLSSKQNTVKELTHQTCTQS